MHDLRKIAHVCLDEVIAAGITPGNIAAYNVNGRLSRSWGRCKTDRLLGVSSIEIQPFLLNSKTPVEVLKMVLIHEILHSCRGCQNHGALWKSYAARMNARYHYNIARIVSAETIAACEQAGTYRRRMDNSGDSSRYAIECTTCGAIYTRSRMSDFVRCPHAYRCGNCDGNAWKRLR